MRPKLTFLLLLALATIATSSWIIIKSSAEKMACQKKTNCKKPPVPESGGGSQEVFESGINHMIVSTIK